MKFLHNEILKNILVSVALSLAIMIFTSGSVMADEKTKLFISNKQYMNQLVLELSQDLTTRDASNIYQFIVNNSDYIEVTEQNELRNTKAAIGTVAGSVTDCEVYYSTYEYNTTSDGVIMADLKINNGDYNKLYLIEYHVNKDGRIYGHNIWAY